MIIRLIQNLLSRQDPQQAHTLLTRMVVSGILLFVNLVLAGFYGVLAATAVYLVVEWGGFSTTWVMAPIAVALLVGLRKGLLAIQDYWQGYGH
ncbi:MAG: hypothetical protein VYA55_18745 [Pseudomonadota bacterium]|nr:hypothetical protein [Pseudomonadota bacterium]